MFDMVFNPEWSTMKKLIWLKATLLSGASAIIKTVTGTAPITLTNAISHAIISLTQTGKCVQDGTPTPDAPVDILCNNGVIKYSANMANVNADTALVGYYVSAQGVVTADTNNWIYQEYIPVLPNTTYTLSMSSPVYYVTISEYSTAEDSGFVIRKTGSTGTNTSLTITTGATTNYIRFGTNIDRAAVTLERVLAVNWMLNIGDTAMDYQPYVEGGIYTDGTPEVLTVSGKNLFDKNDSDLQYRNRSLATTKDGYWWYAEGSTSLACPCLPNTQYTISGINQSTGFFRVATIDVDTLPSQQETYSVPYSYIYRATQSEVHTFVTHSTAKWIIVQVGSNYYDSTLTTIQIEQGSSATDYESYHAPQTITNIPMLLSVGDYKDEVELIAGIKTGKVGVKVFDGTEDWTASSSYAGSCYTTISGSLNAPTGIAVLCSHFENSVTLDTYSRGKCTKQNAFNLWYGDNRTTAVADLKAKLAAQYANGTPVIVLYPLATETTEQTTPHALHTTAGTNVVDVTAEVSGISLAAQYKATE